MTVAIIGMFEKDKNVSLNNLPFSLCYRLGHIRLGRKKAREEVNSFRLVNRPR